MRLEATLNTQNSKLNTSSYTLKAMLKDKYASAIADILARYAQKRSAVIQLLYLAQDEYGRLTDEAIREVAAIIEVPPTDVFEVVGFYTLLYNGNVGKWVLQVCDDVPCCFLGAEPLIDALEQKLGIRSEQTTADGMFTLQRVKCVAACDKAPVLQANLDFVYNLTVEQLDGMLSDLRRRADAGETISISGRQARV
ncbi:MAG TPA: NAD(P)H-dependent oxidoreductase subunit E [Roseiflexaceae bacterium]|nr:NAD(P)H-dependent oxidoreductase subunit E [Roseiflexaceae bacterium]